MVGRWTQVYHHSIILAEIEILNNLKLPQMNKNYYKTKCLIQIHVSPNNYYSVNINTLICKVKRVSYWLIESTSVTPLTPPPPLEKNSSVLHKSHGSAWPRLGGQLPPPAPRGYANEIKLYYFWNWDGDIWIIVCREDRVTYPAWFTIWYLALSRLKLHKTRWETEPVFETASELGRLHRLHPWLHILSHS